MKVSNLAFLSAILPLSTADAKKKNKKNANVKKNNGKKTAPASKPNNKKPNGDISDLFKSNKNKQVAGNKSIVNSRKNTNNRKKKGGNNKKKGGNNNKKKKPGNTAQRAVDDDLLLAVDTDIPTYIPTVRHILIVVVFLFDATSYTSFWKYSMLLILQYMPTYIPTVSTHGCCTIFHLLLVH